MDEESSKPTIVKALNQHQQMCIKHSAQYKL